MSEPESNPDSESRSTPPRSPATTWGRRLTMTLRVAQVRLRFVIVLLVAFLVVGQWGTLRVYWDAITYRLTGTKPGGHGVSSDTEFWCPMCPGVLSDWPAICPICNMDLQPRKKGEPPMLPEGVVARMQFAPYRIQLAGIRTSVVRRQPLVREIVLAGRFSRDDGAEAGSLLLDCPAWDSDLPFLTTGRQAAVTVDAMPGQSPAIGIIETSFAGAAPEAGGESGVRIRIASPPGAWRPGTYAVARVEVPISELEPFRSQLDPAVGAASEGVVSVPRTAIVDTGARQVVYVETMPGMFDGRVVTLGPRCGELFPVVSGVQAGEKVATVGAFLIDAEARLDRTMATAYFGAAQTAGAQAIDVPATETEATTPGRKSARRSKSKLSAADQALAKEQRICPVTELPLDSMGGPVPVEVAGRKVFICCQGCEARLRQEPQKYLAKLRRAKE